MKKCFAFMKRHIILMVGVGSFFLAITADFYMLLFNVQYDEGGIKTLLFLGFPVYAFPYWLVFQILQPLKLSPFLLRGLTYLMGITAFFVIDILWLFLKTRDRKLGPSTNKRSN